MAGRQNKVGLDYFELDCHMDDKIKLIEAEFGLKGFAIVVKLYQGIYSGFGYYCEWTPDIALLWAMQLGISPGGVFGKLDSVAEETSLPGFPKNLITNVVAASIRRGIFSEELFHRYHILTSSGIQKRYLNATSKREKVELKKEYLLISVPENRSNVVINSISDGRNSINSVRNAQSREEKSKEENKDTLCKADALALFERLWKLYPCKKGKGQVSDAGKMRLLQIGFNEMSRAIERYLAELEKDKDWRKPQNGSTFFNSGYIDYLDANYEASSKQTGSRIPFNDFQQREYDDQELENFFIREVEAMNAHSTDEDRKGESKTE